MKLMRDFWRPRRENGLEPGRLATTACCRSFVPKDFLTEDQGSR